MHQQAIASTRQDLMQIYQFAAAGDRTSEAAAWGMGCLQVLVKLADCVAAAAPEAALAAGSANLRIPIKALQAESQRQWLLSRPMCRFCSGLRVDQTSQKKILALFKAACLIRCRPPDGAASSCPLPPTDTNTQLTIPLPATFAAHV